VDGRPLFLVYRSDDLPEPRRTTDLWRAEVVRLGLPEPYLCRVESFAARQVEPSTQGFDAAVEFQPKRGGFGPPIRPSVTSRIRHLGGSRHPLEVHNVSRYADMMEKALRMPRPEYKRFPCVTPSWDNTARRQHGAHIVHDSTPELYRSWLQDVVSRFEPFGPDENLVFINAWNEWAEGSHLEPDNRWGHGYLEATAAALSSASALTGDAPAIP
jgi:hypothetical protein